MRVTSAKIVLKKSTPETLARNYASTLSTEDLTCRGMLGIKYVVGMMGISLAWKKVLTVTERIIRAGDCLEAESTVSGYDDRLSDTSTPVAAAVE
ncbi:hypothetical protein TNCV_1511751 [Trichonephila clavipes]|nr:hypothetical protein TNCV_1511751 [Trichonephila clavipes]